MFCIGNIQDVTVGPTGVPWIQILYDATASFAGAYVLSSWIVVIALVSLCFLYAQKFIVAFAFARDRCLPFSNLAAESTANAMTMSFLFCG